MKDLSITQQYLVCTVNEKGVLPGYEQKAVACLVVCGLLELQMEQCISISDKKITVCAPLPERMAYLEPLYGALDQGKPVKAASVVEAYTITFTNKKLNTLVDALLHSLEQAGVTQPVKAGLLGGKEGCAPKKETVTRIIEAIRAELLEDGEVSEEVAALTALLDKSNRLKDYFSRYEQKELKKKLEAIRASETGAFIKEMLQHIDALAAAASLPAAIAATT